MGRFALVCSIVPLLLVFAGPACKQAGPDPSATGGAGGAGGAGGGPSCVEQCVTAHPAGATAYDDLLDCLLCQSCYFDCDGKTVQGCEAPATAGDCDQKGVCRDQDDIDTNDCQACALASTCAEALKTCQDKPECVKFGQCIEPCP